jgi:hypothetical protein
LRGKRFVLGIIVILFIAQGIVTSAMFPTWKERYSTGEKGMGIAPGLSIDQLLASVAGLREMVAGILWVQSDELFHSGQFDAILPVIRLVTWLNPRQIEVYSTGSWHIAYNFTDDQNRSDRRYIPLALRLLKEGTENNPNTYELFHQSGWMYFHKIDDDYSKAVYWFEQAVKKPDIMQIPAIRSVLATSYQRNGQLDKGLDYFWRLQEDAEKRFERTKEVQDMNMRDTQERNVDNTIMRMISRGYFGKRDGVYDEYPYDTHNPVDLKFTVKVAVLQPKVIRVTGTWGIPTTGARVRMVLRDADYDLKWDPAPSLDFDRDRDKTFMLDPLYTQDGRFDRKIDMSTNPTMYRMKGEKYYLEFYFNPRSAPPHIQDKIGWNGEGMTDARYINTDIRPGTRVLFARLEITRDQLLQRGEGPFVVKSPGYKEIESKYDKDVIIKKSLRAQ